MRDPERIPKILEKIRILWEKNPDWRLGQLLENAKDISDSHWIDTWSMEEEMLEQGLDRLIAVEQGVVQAPDLTIFLSPLCYNRRRKTMTFLRSKNAGTESELSVARRTKVPALGSWM